MTATSLVELAELAEERVELATEAHEPVLEDGPVDEAEAEAVPSHYKFDEQRLLTRVAITVRIMQEQFRATARIFDVVWGFDARLGRVLAVRFDHEISPEG
jgi:hypothetical protein